MFRLAYEEGYGAQRIANTLNAMGIKNRAGKNWHPATIQGILRNILYIGILRSGNRQSPPQERLRIIEDRVFYGVANLRAARSKKHAEERSVPLNTRGESLLAGNVFCGHCGARLCLTTSGQGRPRQDGSDSRRTRYTCQTKSRTHGQCDGQTGYTMHKLDDYVDAIIRGIFSRVKSLSREEILRVCRRGDLDMKKSLLKKAERDYEKADSDLQRLKGEIVRSLTGESAYSPELLSAVIEDQKKKCAGLQAHLASAREVFEEARMKSSELDNQFDELIAWSTAYDTATMAARKMIVAHIINRVDVYRDYQLKITLNISVEQFLVNLERGEQEIFTA